MLLRHLFYFIILLLFSTQKNTNTQSDEKYFFTMYSNQTYPIIYSNNPFSELLKIDVSYTPSQYGQRYLSISLISSSCPEQLGHLWIFRSFIFQILLSFKIPPQTTKKAHKELS